MDVRNIGPGGCRRRYLIGAGALALGVVVAAVLVWLGAPRGARAALLVPFWVAGLGFFQAREHT